MNEVVRYNDQEIKFNKANEMVNITNLWRAYGRPENKQPFEWLRQGFTGEIIKTIKTGLKPVLETDVIRKEPGRYGGTWAHRLIAMEYARYLDVKFALWCNENIFKLMEIGHVILDQQCANMELSEMALRMAEKQGKAIGKEVGKKVYSAIRDEFNPKIIHLEKRVSGLERGVKTKQIPAIVKNKHIKILEYECGMRCPATNRRLERHEIEFDHFHDPDKATIYNTWPIHKELNRAFTYEHDSRENYVPEFRRYQRFVEKHYPIKGKCKGHCQLDLF